MKVVINGCFGGFSLSDEAYEWLIKNKGWRSEHIGEDGFIVDKTAELWHDDSEDRLLMMGKYCSVQSQYESEFRSNPDVIAVVEALGEVANGGFAKLKVVEIPDDISWGIDEYDGMESIAETHRSWR